MTWDSDHEGRLHRILEAYAVTRRCGGRTDLVYCLPSGPDDPDQWTKVVYATQERAVAADVVLQRQVHNRPAKAFPCPRGDHWHLTEKGRRETAEPQPPARSAVGPRPLMQRPFAALETLKLTAPDTGEEPNQC